MKCFVFLLLSACLCQASEFKLLFNDELSDATYPEGVWTRDAERVNTFDLRQFTSAKTNPDGSTTPPWLSKAPADLPQKGKIGFQGKHGGAPIYLRNIEILEL